MTFAIFYIALWSLCIAASTISKQAPATIAIKLLNETFSTQNMLIAWGIVGICRRLDKIIKKEASK